MINIATVIAVAAACVVAQSHQHHPAAPARGRAAEAEQVFRDDLTFHARNGRSLFGLWKALEAQGRKADAARAQAEFRRAWTAADVTLRLELF